MKKQGIFIVFEGIDGAGKTCQIEKTEAWFKEQGDIVVRSREPGGCNLGQDIRKMLLNPENKEMAPLTELLLYAADRSQHVHEVLQPGLDQGNIVISDRYTLSTLAYQGYGRNLDMDTIKTLNHIATKGLKPHLTFLLDIPEAIGRKRINTTREETPDRLEQEKDQFFQRIRQGYLEEAKHDDTIVIIDGTAKPDQVFAAIKERLESLRCRMN